MKKILEIKSKSGKLHFQRWQLLELPWFSIWIHAIHAADEDKHMHNHPWDYASVVLKGSYLEESQRDIETNTTLVQVQKPFKINIRNGWGEKLGAGFHKIKKLQSPVVWTLFFVTPKKRTWGYKVDGKFIDHETYRQMKHDNKL